MPHQKTLNPKKDTILDFGDGVPEEPERGARRPGGRLPETQRRGLNGRSLGRQRSRLSKAGARIRAGAGDRSSRGLGGLRGRRRGQEDGVAPGFSNERCRRQVSRRRGRHDRPPKANQKLLLGLVLGLGSRRGQCERKTDRRSTMLPGF